MNLNRLNKEIHRKWIRKSEKRYDAYKPGKIKALSYPEVLNKIKNE